MQEAFRLALSAAEREIDAFHGDIDVLLEAHKYVRSVGGDVSENVNEFLAESLSE